MQVWQIQPLPQERGTDVTEALNPLTADHSSFERSAFAAAFAAAIYRRSIDCTINLLS
jgi:hypothetical protein